MTDPARVEQRKSRVLWFEIPTTNLDRAIAFYESILPIQLNPEQFGPSQLAIFPYAPPAVSGCLLGPGPLQPGAGPVLYLNADPDLDAVLARVEGAGGKVLVPRTELPPGMGCFAHIRDSEGNLVGLHAVS